MNRYKVYVDAAADIPDEQRKRYQINVLPIPVSIDGKTYQSGTELSNAEFYALMENSASLPVTSQVTPYAFEELFAKELAEDTERLMLFLINSKGSATYGNAISTREAFLSEHADAGMRIDVLDGGSYSGGYGYAAILAAQKLEMGLPYDDVLSLAEEQLQKQRIYFGMYTLKYAGKSGRIPSAAVFVGEALGIKPIMRVWDHEITTAGKARGEKKLIHEIVKMTISDMEINTPYSLLYGSDADAMNELKDEMTKKVGYPPVYAFQIGAAVAINAGPRMVATVFEVRKKKRDAK